MNLRGDENSILYIEPEFSSPFEMHISIRQHIQMMMDVAVICCNSEDLASEPVVQTVTVTQQNTRPDNTIKDLLIGFLDRLWGSR